MDVVFTVLLFGHPPHQRLMFWLMPCLELLAHKYLCLTELLTPLVYYVSILSLLNAFLGAGVAEWVGWGLVGWLGDKPQTVTGLVQNVCASCHLAFVAVVRSGAAFCSNWGPSVVDLREATQQSAHLG